MCNPDISDPVEKAVEIVPVAPVELVIYLMWNTACVIHYRNYCSGRRALYKNHIFSVKTNFGCLPLF
jgi:hypothetical protein